MSLESLLPIATFLCVAAITPGPNNFLVMAAAARGGLRAALPAIAGVLVGALGLLLLVWLGAAAVFERWPALRTLLLVCGALYLGWLGAVLFRQAGRDSVASESPTSTRALPSSTVGVALFQFLNPKAWLLTLTITAAAAGGEGGASTLGLLAALILVVSTSCLTLWASAGALLVRWLERPAAKARFERVMGALLVASAAWLVFAPA